MPVMTAPLLPDAMRAARCSSVHWMHTGWRLYTLRLYLACVSRLARISRLACARILGIWASFCAPRFEIRVTFSGIGSSLAAAWACA